MKLASWKKKIDAENKLLATKILLAKGKKTNFLFSILWLNSFSSQNLIYGDWYSFVAENKLLGTKILVAKGKNNFLFSIQRLNSFNSQNSIYGD